MLNLLSTLKKNRFVKIFIIVYIHKSRKDHIKYRDVILFLENQYCQIN